MDTAIEATGPVEASHPEDTDEHAARPANGAAVAQDTDLPGARPVVPNQPGAAAGLLDAGQQATPADGGIMSYWSAIRLHRIGRVSAG
jgi:hypothetical protein